MTLEEFKSLKMGDKITIIKSPLIDIPTEFVVASRPHIGNGSGKWLVILKGSCPIIIASLSMIPTGLYLDYINDGSVIIDWPGYLRIFEEKMLNLDLED